ncbi:MAG: DUF4291 domain-containing protein [Dysgonomonas sp.]
MNSNTIRADYDKDTITIYQAFNKYIAQTAIDNQTFISPPFKKERMTWVKPSFLWMMYRSGWATKIDQEYILAIRIKRSGFEWALKNSCLSRFDSNVDSSYDNWKENLAKSPIRIQWDPERNIFMQPLNYGSIQVGLSGNAIDEYISNWIISIEDITNYCKQIHQLIYDNKIIQAKNLLPNEQLYPLPEDIAIKINSYL